VVPVQLGDNGFGVVVRTDALASVIPALVSEEPPNQLDIADMRFALRHFLLAPPSRTLDRPPTAAAALRWLEKASLPVSDVGTPKYARAALDATTVLQDGRAASATTIARKRSVFANVLRYAVEIEELPSNPLDRLSWKPPKVSEVVDRRIAVNPLQARELLAAVTYVGYQRRGLTPAQVVSPLAGRPYDLRHAAVSLWLNAGVPATQVAERAGHSVEVLLRVYAKWLDGGDKVANMRIDAAPRDFR
jgi:hypothetical protein